MTDFRDFDPEDAYDAGDPFDERFRVLERVLDSLRDNRDERFDGRRADILRVIRNVDGEDLNRRERRHLHKLRDELEEL